MDRRAFLGMGVTGAASLAPGAGVLFGSRAQAARAENPHVKFFDGRLGGCLRCGITPERWRSDLRLVGSTGNPQAAVGTLASFVVENGRPGAVRV